MQLTFEKLLEYVRISRNFDPELYISKKANSLFNLCGGWGKKCIDTFVVPQSGGIDSAVVFWLLDEMKRNHNQDKFIKKIVPVFMPIYCNDGISGQEDAQRRAKEVMEMRGYKYSQFDLTVTANYFFEQSDEFTPKKNVAWAHGQGACILRTPASYYIAAVLQTQGYKSIVVGTTNRDEGAYIGFFGKASDGMNDLQLISDLHKSEVIILAEYLGVPRSIIDATPKGDVFDSRVDEEMIGAPYWFLELYIRLREMQNLKKLDYLPKDEMQMSNKWIKNIENLHNTNLHKYQVGSPAHYLDVYPRCVAGGWKDTKK